MIETIKELIIDFHETRLPEGVARHIELCALPGKAAICIGPRRCGKTTLMHQLIAQLEKNGVSRQNILYINFFDDRLHNLKHHAPGMVTEAYFALFPEKKGCEKIYCFFDEIQQLPQWEAFVDRLMRTENCEVYITGSSAQMLSREIATQMRGRSLTWELFPFSFAEYLDYRQIDRQQPFSSARRLKIQKAFAEYFVCGGFPETVSLPAPLRIRVHQEYFNAMLFRDLVERHDISHPRALSELAHRLVDNIASLYTINSLTGYLQSTGHRAPKASVSDYLKWFSDAFCLMTVRLFDASLSRSNVNPKKIYCIDHAMAVSTGSGILVNSGNLLENIIYLALRRVTSEIFYYRTSNGREVDFVARLPNSEFELIQICETLAEKKTSDREISALREAMHEMKLSTGTIVSRHHEETIELEKHQIKIVPAWKFLLSLT